MKALHQCFSSQTKFYAERQYIKLMVAEPHRLEQGRNLAQALHGIQCCQGTLLETLSVMLSGAPGSAWESPPLREKQLYVSGSTHWPKEGKRQEDEDQHSGRTKKCRQCKLSITSHDQAPPWARQTLQAPEGGWWPRQRMAESSVVRQ